MYFTDVNIILFILCISVWLKLGETMQVEIILLFLHFLHLFLHFRKYLKYLYTLHFQQMNILEYLRIINYARIELSSNSYL